MFTRSRRLQTGLQASITCRITYPRRRMHRPAQLCRCRCGVHQRLCRRKVKQGVSGRTVKGLRLAKGKEVERSQPRIAAIEPSLRQALWPALSQGGAQHRSLHPFASPSMAHCSLAPFSPAMHGGTCSSTHQPSWTLLLKTQDEGAAADKEPSLGEFPPSPSSFFSKAGYFFLSVLHGRQNPW